MILDFYVWLSNILNFFVIPVLLSVALVIFLWGVLKYVSSGDDEEKRNSGRNFIVYGIIGLFVMVSVWGLVAVLNRTFGIRQGGVISGVPLVSGQNTGEPSSFNVNTFCPDPVPLPPTNFTNLICLGIDYIQATIYLLVALSLAVFLFGVIRYVVLRGGEEKERAKARSFMLYGIIALFVMVSVWGLVAILNRSLGIGQGGSMSKIELKGEL